MMTRILALGWAGPICIQNDAITNIDWHLTKKTKNTSNVCVDPNFFKFNPGKYCSTGTSGILDLRQATQGHRDGSCVFIFLCSIFRLIDAWFTFWVHLKLRYITADIYIYILMLGFKISKFNCFEMLFIYFFPYKKIFESVAIDLLHLHDIFLLLWQNNVNHTIPPDDERMSSLLFTAHTLTRRPLSAVSVYLSANKTGVTWTCGGDGDRSRAAVPSWETIFRADSHFWQWIEASSTSAQIVTATYTKLE